MAFDAKPTSWITSYASSGTEITMPIATFPQLTSSEANATTGDIRKVLFAICDKLMSVWNNTTGADRPAKWTMSNTATVDPVNGQITRTYTFRFVTAASGEEVVAE